MLDFDSLRSTMIVDQLQRRGIRDPRVLWAMARVPRHLFVPPVSQARAYADQALPIGEGQTISQPYMVAVMTESLALSGSEHVLDIGTGSGYQAAILGELARDVITIERRADLAREAGARLAELGYRNIRVVVADGSQGYAPGSPYDAILVAAGAPSVPLSLKAQLAEGGRLAVPVGPLGLQELKIVTRRGDEFGEALREGCVFVPLIGREGWTEE